MSKLFFDHLILREELTADLSVHDLDSETQKELLELIDEIINHHVLNLILSHLPKDHHADFISRLTANPSDEEILPFLKTKISIDLELELKKHLSKIKSDLKTEIKKAKSKA